MVKRTSLKENHNLLNPSSPKENNFQDNRTKKISNK